MSVPTERDRARIQDVLYDALRKLRNEIDGWMQWDYHLIEVGGVTNLNVLKLRLEEAEQAIMKADDEPLTDYDSGHKAGHDEAIERAAEVADECNGQVWSSNIATAIRALHQADSREGQ